MRLIKKYQGSGQIDPVQQAYKESDIDWDAVGEAISKVKADRSLPYMAKDTLAFMDKWLADKGVSEMQRNIIIGRTIIESGGSPSMPSKTGPNPTYYGLLQWELARLKDRTGGYPGLLIQLQKVYDDIHSTKSWTKGFDDTGLTYHKEGYELFTNPEKSDRFIPKSFNLRQTLQNKATWGFVTGYIRPRKTAYETLLTAVGAKAIQQNRGKKGNTQNENNKEVSESSQQTNGRKR